MSPVIPISKGSPQEYTVKTDGNPPSGGDMEARVARLEAAVEYIQRDISELKADVRSTKSEISAIRTTDFRLLFGAIITVALGLAGIMAKGFNWI